MLIVGGYRVFFLNTVSLYRSKHHLSTLIIPFLFFCSLTKILPLDDVVIGRLFLTIAFEFIVFNLLFKNNFIYPLTQLLVPITWRNFMVDLNHHLAVNLGKGWFHKVCLHEGLKGDYPKHQSEQSQKEKHK